MKYSPDEVLIVTVKVRKVESEGNECICEIWAWAIFWESWYTMVLEETRATQADRIVKNVPMKLNFNMQVCGLQEKSRWTAAGWADTMLP